MSKTDLPPKGFNPFTDLIGLEITEAGPGHSVCELNVVPAHMNPSGVLHGGIPYSMADTGMGVAIYKSLEKGQRCATIEIKITYLRPVVSGRLICETQVIQRGRRFAFVESEVRNADRIVAKATGTFVINDHAEPAASSEGGGDQ
jgi:acyl-CoA thioesterase